MAFQQQPLFLDPIAQGTLAATNAIIILQLNNSSGAIVNVSGTWVGTILLEGSNDGFVTSQNAAVFTPPAGVITTGITTNGYYRFVAVSGFTQIRARMSSYTSGSALVILSASIGAGLAPTVSVNYDSMLVKAKITDGTDVTNVTTSGDLTTNDGIRAGGSFGNLNLVTANTAYEVKVDGGRLTNRKLITIIPTDSDMYWGYNNTVTTSTGTPLYKNQLIIISTIDDTTQIWLVCANANKNARITEVT